MYKELTVREWEIEITRALEYRQKYGLEKHWHDLELHYLNQHGSQSSNAPNVIMSTGDTVTSSLSVPYPYMVVTPENADTVDTAPVVEATANMLMGKMDLAEETESTYLSAYLWGRGIMKIGYDSEFGWSEKLDVGGKKSPLGMSLSQYDKKQWRIEFGDTTPGMPWTRAIMPHDFLVPWGTGPRLETAEWAIHRICRHIEDVKSDQKYSNTKELQANLTAEDYMQSYQTTLKPYRMGSVYARGWEETRRPEYVELWEIHDKRTGKVMVICTGYDKFIRNEPDLLQIRGLPFTSLSFTKNPKTFWTTPPAYYLLQAQLELTDITIQGTKLRRSNIPKAIIDEDAFDPEEVEKLTSARVGGVIKKKGGMSMESAVKMLQQPPNLEIYQEGENVRRNIRETIGLGRNQVGEFEPTGRRTAFEVETVAKSSELRMDSRQLSAKRLYVLTMRKVLALCQEWWKTPRLVRILDENAIQQWTKVVGQSLQGDFAFEMNFTNEGGQSLSSRRQAAIQLFPVLAQDPLTDPVSIRRWLIRSMADPSMSSVYPKEILQGQIPAEVLQQIIQQGKQGTPGAGGVQPAQNSLTG